MASITAALSAAPAVALSVSASASTSTGARAQLAAPALKCRTVSKPLEWASKTVSNGSRVNAFNVVNPENNIRYETLSFLPPLSDEQILKQIEYLLKNNWIPALEFDKFAGVTRGVPPMPNNIDGRYWTMWKLPLFGAKDPAQVLNEVKECTAAYPKSFIRIIGFDNKRQVQVISFIVYKPEGY